MSATTTTESPATSAVPTAEPLDVIAELAEDLADRGIRASSRGADDGTDASGLAEAGRLLRAVDRLVATVITVLMRLDRTQVIAAEGLTVESWLRAAAGRTGADAGMLLVAAQRLADMPATLAAFQRGVVSWGTVRGIVAATRSLTVEQRRWLDEVVARDDERLARVDGDTLVADAEHAADRARPDLARDRADRSAAAQRLLFQPGLDGGGTAVATLDAETFTAVQTAIESLTHDATGRRIASNVEALRALARQRVTRTTSADPASSDAASTTDATGGTGAPGADGVAAATGRTAGGAPSTARPEMIVVTDISLLAEPLDGLDHRGLDGMLLQQTRAVARLLWRQDRPAPRLTPAAARRLSCDATIRPVLTDGARVLGTAEPYARVSAPLRAALIARDGGCRFAACHRPVDVCEAHHIHHRVDGGPTVLANLALLCGAHHRAVHEGGWAPVLHDDASMTFTRRGTTLHSMPRCATAPPGVRQPPAGRPRRTRDADRDRHVTATAPGDPQPDHGGDAAQPSWPPDPGPLPF